MGIFLFFVFLIPILFLLWCLLLVPRRNHPGWERFAGIRYAHRGLHNTLEGWPENSLAAFRRAAEGGFGAELDVHLMADGNLAVIHDSSLQRVCGKNLAIEDRTAAELPDYPLEGTRETIPLLQDVLGLFEGKAPLIIELKAERGNAAALTDAAMALLKGWNGVYCIESFHPAVLWHLKKHYPDVLRGQLSQDFLRDRELQGPSKLALIVMTLLLTTFLTSPDFIAYKHTDRGCLSLQLMRKLYGVHEVGWTVRDHATMERLEAKAVLPIFENFIP